MQKTIIILFLFFLFSCNEFKEDSKGDFNQFVAVCSSEMAILLADGGMDSSDFMQEIMNNMQIL